MKVNDPNLASLAQSTGASRTQETDRTSLGSSTNRLSGTGGSSDDVHLSELVRSLRSLAADSPERQARLEQIARSVANGSYQVDARATASKILDDAFES
jgi:flagellar biosynthesis anti-sigma factor FlgM